MDMNRKSRLCLINKKTQMAASLMQKFLLVMAFFVMMAATAHAGAFLYNHDVKDIDSDGLTENDVIDNSSLPSIFNRSNLHTTDNWQNWDDDTDDPGVYTGDSYTGFYLGTFSGNESEDLLKKLIASFLNITIDESWIFAKYDETEDEEYSLEVTIDNPIYKDSDIISGTWNVTDSENPEVGETIDFYSVKGSKEFALYYVDPAQSSGIWTTAHLKAGTSDNPPGLSHITIMKTTETPTTFTDPVPEPATLILFGFSLMGLAGMARRRNSKF